MFMAVLFLVLWNINNSSNLETIQMSFSRWMITNRTGKQTTGLCYCRITDYYSALKRKHYWFTRHLGQISRGLCSATEANLARLYIAWFYLYCTNGQNYSSGEQIQGCQDLERRKKWGRDAGMEEAGLLESLESFPRTLVYSTGNGRYFRLGGKKNSSEGYSFQGPWGHAIEDGQMAEWRKAE